MLSQPRFLHRSDNSFSSNCGTDEEFSCALFDRASEYASCESKTADRRRAAQLLQEIDKAALVCPRRSGGARAIHARRAARRSHFHSLFGATGAPRSPSLCLAALQSMRTSLGRSAVERSLLLQIERRTKIRHGRHSEDRRLVWRVLPRKT